MDIFVLDNTKHIIDTLYIGDGQSPISDDKYIRYLKTGAETFECTFVLDEQRAYTTIEGNFLLFTYNEKIKMMQIKTTEDLETAGCIQRTIYAEFIGLELANNIVRPCMIEGNPLQFLTTVLQDTNFKVGEVSDTTSQDIQTIKIDKPTCVYTVLQDAINQFSNIEYEFEVKCINSIYGNYEFYINIYADGERGRKTYKRFEYDHNIYGCKQKTDISEFCSGLIATGQNGVTFKDVRWEIDRGDPLDKPEGQDFLIDPEAHKKFFQENDRPILGVFEGTSDNGADLLWETYTKLQEIKQPKYDWTIPVYLSNAEYQDLEPGDTVWVFNPKFTPPIQLEGRLNTITISFTHPDNSSVEISNYKVVKSKIKSLSGNDIIENTINSILGLGVGKLSQNDIALIRQLLGQLDNDKADVDEIIKEIVAILKPDIPQLPDSVPVDSEDYTKITVSQIDGGLWIGDERMYDILHYAVATIVKQEEIITQRPVVQPGNPQNTPSQPDSQQYKDAINYYSKYWLGKNASNTTLQNVIKGSDKYKIGVMVRYWANRFGLDERLVYCLMMQESGMNPYSATSSSIGGYGLMQCERGVYFNKTQTIKFLDGSTQSFTPSYSTMKPGKGNTTINGVTVDKNISNQIMFGCNELRMNLEKWRYNIFATLVGYNMGVGAMGWIIIKYVCDTYGYKFNNERSLSKCSAQVKAKAYEVLDTMQMPWAAYRQQWKNYNGGGTVQHVEYCLRYYVSDNGQLPYCVVNGKKVGYGVSSTSSTSSYVPVVTTLTPQTSNNVRDKLVSMAKLIVSEHVDQKIATYSQSPRTIRHDKPQRCGGTRNGLKNPIGYDCTSLVSCCYYNGGLTSVYNTTASGSTMVKNACSKSGWKAWKLTKSNLETYAKPGDIIMVCKKTVGTDVSTNPTKYAYCSHAMMYVGDGRICHASGNKAWPKAIRNDNIYDYYIKKNNTFILRPWDLAQADLVQPESSKPQPTPENPNPVIPPDVIWVDDKIIQTVKIVEQTFKGVPGCGPQQYMGDEFLIQDVSLNGYTDNIEYPLTVPYVFVHFGRWCLAEPQLEKYVNLLKTLKAKYPNTPIFVAKAWKVRPNYNEGDVTTINSQIQNLNDTIAALAAEEQYIIQLDYDNIKDDTGAIKASLTTNGHRLKDAAAVQIYYNAMKEAIKNKRIGGISKQTAVNNISTNNVNIIANTNHLYNSGVCTSYKFEIPTYTTLDYWSRITFSTVTSGEPTRFTQPDNVWLEGNDCKEGALIPKAATTYVINLYASSIQDDYYGVPYFGIVNSTTNDGSYATFETFVGGDKVAEIANTYYNNNSKLKFITPATTPMYFDNPAANIDGWKNKSTGIMGIDSQTLCKLCYMGIDYENSPYAHNDMTKVVRNTVLPWSFEFAIWAQSQCKYCVQHGWALSDVDLTNFSNLKPGDIIYYSNRSNANYMSLTGIAIYVGNNNAIGIDETGNKTVEKFDIKTSSTLGGKSKIIMVARPRKE